MTHNLNNTSRITRYFRISRISLHTLIGVMVVGLVFPLANKTIRLTLIKWWCKQLLAAFNLRVTKQGYMPPENQVMMSTMVVANHISWTDIYALNSIVPLQFIAKSEIKSWPIFGYLARKTDVLFIERNKHQHATHIVYQSASRLMQGDNLCLFPEGTTTDGTTIMPFKSSIIQAAIHANATIHPVAIRYPSLDGNVNTGMAYAGDTTMKESILQILSQKESVVELHFLAPIKMEEWRHAGKDRRELTLHIHGLIREKLGL